MILREAFEYSFSHLDPFGAHIDPPSVAVYETLLVKAPDWQPQPQLVKSWTVSADERTYRFRLRPNLHFHSGDRCDARAVVAALDRLRWGFYPDRQHWYWDPVDSIRAEQDETLVVSLRWPSLRLFSLLWGTHTAIFNAARQAEDPEGFGTRVADGTGPFRLVHWSPERIAAERWGDYPGAGATFLRSSGPERLDAIEWVAIPDEDDRLHALERGEVDCLHAPVPSEIERLTADPRFKVVSSGQSSNVYLGLDWRRRELGFDDLRIRRAISLGIDRQRLVRDALAGHGAPTLGPLPPIDEFYDPTIDAGLTTDPRAASLLLEEAGWQRGMDGIMRRGGLPLACECVVQDDDVHRRIAQGVRTQLASLGIDLRLRFVKSFQAFYAACAAGAPSFINLWLWPDPMDAIIGFCGTRGQPGPNWQHSSIPELDDAFRAWVQAATSAELRQAASRAQRLVKEQLPYVPLLTPENVWVQRRQVHGWEPYPANLYPFYHSTWIGSQ